MERIETTGLRNRYCFGLRRDSKCYACFFPAPFGQMNSKKEIYEKLR